MSLRIGDEAPNFTAQTTEGEINFHEWLGDSWGIIYSHPADFTPVCTTELGLYNMIHPNASTSATVRSVYFIGPDKKIKAIITYPASTGRNFFEILRVIDSLQLTANYSVATPVDWEQGQDVIISPSVKQEDVEAKFPKGHKVIKPYLRYTPQPNK